MLPRPPDIKTQSKPHLRRPGRSLLRPIWRQWRWTASLSLFHPQNIDSIGPKNTYHLFVFRFTNVINKSQNANSLWPGLSLCTNLCNSPAWNTQAVQSCFKTNGSNLSQASQALTRDKKNTQPFKITSSSWRENFSKMLICWLLGHQALLFTINSTRA